MSIPVAPSAPFVPFLASADFRRLPPPTARLGRRPHAPASISTSGTHSPRPARAPLRGDNISHSACPHASLLRPPRPCIRRGAVAPARVRRLAPRRPPAGGCLPSGGAVSNIHPGHHAPPRSARAGARRADATGAFTRAAACPCPRCGAKSITVTEQGMCGADSCIRPGTAANGACKSR